MKNKQIKKKTGLSHSIIILREKIAYSDILCICFPNTERNEYKRPLVIHQASSKIIFIPFTIIETMYF